jgi:hypothetical protein
MHMKNKIIVVALGLVAAFLIGFVPQYIKANRTAMELRQAYDKIAEADLRDLISLTYFQANQKNYGLAAATASRFFSRCRGVADHVPDVSHRKDLEQLVALRDRVTAKLAKGDAAVMSDLQELFDKTWQATQASAS